jgi:hypothetical protein
VPGVCLSTGPHQERRRVAGLRRDAGGNRRLFLFRSRRSSLGWEWWRSARPSSVPPPACRQAGQGCRPHRAQEQTRLGPVRRGRAGAIRRQSAARAGPRGRPQQVPSGRAGPAGPGRGRRESPPSAGRGTAGRPRLGWRAPPPLGPPPGPPARPLPYPRAGGGGPGRPGAPGTPTPGRTCRAGAGRDAHGRGHRRGHRRAVGAGAIGAVGGTQVGIVTDRDLVTEHRTEGHGQERAARAGLSVEGASAAPGRASLGGPEAVATRPRRGR